MKQLFFCTEEASLRFENALLLPTLKDLANPDLMMKRLQSRTDEMALTMKFHASVCSNDRYKEDMKPILDRLAEKYEYYTEKVAEKLGCSKRRCGAVCLYNHDFGCQLYDFC